MARIGMTLACPDKTGAARMAFFFARALVGAGHEVRLVHGPPPPASILPEMRAAGIATCLEAGLAFPLGPIGRRVARHAQGCDLLIGVNQRDRAVALLAANRLGVPGMLMVQSLHRFWGPWPVPALKRRYYATVLRRHLALAVCCSDAVESELQRDFAISPQRTCVIYNGVDTSGYGPLAPEEAATLRAELGVRPDERLLLTVGRLDAQKGLDVLLEALARVRSSEPWRLVVVGGVTSGAGQARSRRYRQALLAQRERLGLSQRVELAGWREDTARLLGSADLYVHPARFEGWPLALVEAMASGLPVVATDCVGRPRGFEDGRHGFLVPTENVAELAAAIEAVLALEPEERGRWGAEARALACRSYDVGALSQAFVHRVEEVLSRAP